MEEAISRDEGGSVGQAVAAGLEVIHSGGTFGRDQAATLNEQLELELRDRGAVSLDAVQSTVELRDVLRLLDALSSERYSAGGAHLVAGFIQALGRDPRLVDFKLRYLLALSLDADLLREVRQEHMLNE